MTDFMPAIFLGHGNPMNAISTNVYTDAWTAIGKSIPRPKAILCVSAHWYIPGCAVTVDANPRTIHDFGGFPRELFAVEYPAPGSPELAHRVKELLSPMPVELDENWGLDHGTWSVLTHVYPNADIPVVQLSIDERQPPMFHYELGKKLAALRKEGILITGSGNIVHNLRKLVWHDFNAKPYDWAVRFEEKVLELIVKGDNAKVADYENLGCDAMLSIPTPDHYLPLLYILGLRRENDPISFPTQGIEGGSLSMLSVQVG
jgi:4,5-DOPA dioxygenase extradiol